jgi:hypothetical protein
LRTSSDGDGVSWRHIITAYLTDPKPEAEPDPDPDPEPEPEAESTPKRAAWLDWVCFLENVIDVCPPIAPIAPDVAKEDLRRIREAERWLKTQGKLIGDRVSSMNAARVAAGQLSMEEAAMDVTPEGW